MIQELQNLSKEELIQKWQKVFKIEPPTHMKITFLIKHLSWELQAKEYGGLSVHTKKQLEKLAQKMCKKTELNKSDIKNTCKNTNLDIRSGTKLIREYQGKKYEVSALEKGFEYKDKKYKSLSAIANEITGTRWNGKIFFGVKK